MLCIGLDPDLALMPEGYGADDVAKFNIAIIEATSDLVCAYKPNVAFYEALGPERGYAALRATLAAIPPHVITLADAKRGDVEHTARAYAQAIFDDLGFDAATVNPYLGFDSVVPWIERPDKMAIVVCRTSNPGAPDFQDLQRGDGGRRAPAVRGRGGAGAVVGPARQRRTRRRRDLPGRDAPVARALSRHAVPGAGHRRAAGFAGRRRCAPASTRAAAGCW